MSFCANSKKFLFFLSVYVVIFSSTIIKLNVHQGETNQCNEVKFQRFLPLTDVCHRWNMVLGKYAKFRKSYDENDNTLQIVFFEAADYTCSATSYNITLNASSCFEMIEREIVFHINFSVVEELPFEASEDLGYLSIQSFDNDVCEGNSTSLFLCSAKYDLKSICTNDFIALQPFGFLDEDYIFIPSQLYDNGGCLTNFTTFFRMSSSISIRVDCYELSELESNIFSSLPRESSTDYYYNSFHYDQNCSSQYYEINIRSLDRCETEFSYFPFVEIKTYEYEMKIFYESNSECGYEELIGMEMLIADGLNRNEPGICNLNWHHYQDETIETFKKIELTDDPYITTQIATIWTTENCSNDITELKKDPNKVKVVDLWYYDEESCINLKKDAGVDYHRYKSIRGGCVKGVIWAKGFTDSINCLGYSEDFSEDICEGYTGGYTHVTCLIRYCDGISETDPNVCNSNGVCKEKDVCECHDEGYFGEFCENWSCFGVDYRLKEETCSGNGLCVDLDECLCNDYTEYYGDNCDIFASTSEYTNPLATILVSVSMIPILLFLLCGLCMIFCCCIICSVFLVLSLMLIGGVSILAYSQKKMLGKFNQLDNFDILLQEQSMEVDTTIAHIRINKSLFQIALEEIDLVKILGEGGSNSTVYKAKWRNENVVAFKCFKTRQVMTTQDDFDEFEREIEVLSSISHPFIIRFFGGCLSPPRVGIVMEFCENGDLNHFLKTYRLEATEEGRSKIMYPLSEKLRMVKEISSAMDYLHSRQIIHRDIKLENSLVDSNEHIKLMDFGLSKIVDRMSKQNTKRVGTSIYMSPEITVSSNYDYKCDVFSFAILTFILVTEKYNPYGDDHLDNIEIRVSQDPNFRPDLMMMENVYSEEENSESILFLLKDMVKRCWDHNPNNRYDFATIVKMLDKLSKSKIVIHQEGGNLVEEMPKSKKTTLRKLENVEEEEERFPKKDDDEVVDIVRELKKRIKKLEFIDREKREKIELLEKENQLLKRKGEKC